MSEPTVTINLHDVPIASQQLTGILAGTKSNLATISDTPVTDPGSSKTVNILNSKNVRILIQKPLNKNLLKNTLRALQSFHDMNLF